MVSLGGKGNRIGYGVGGQKVGPAGRGLFDEVWSVSVERVKVGSGDLIAEEGYSSCECVVPSSCLLGGLDAIVRGYS